MWTIKLLKADHVPSDFREPFIISGYRSCRCTLSTCMVSALQFTNETMNVWTHFGGFLFFLWQTYQTGDRYWKYDDPFTWAFISYLLSCCIYLLTSSFAHLFSCMSERFRHICFFLDYGALSVYSFGCALAYSHYVFPTEYLNSRIHRVYLPSLFLAGVFCTSLACASRLMNIGGLRKTFRMVAFMLPYVCCSLPLLYRILFCEGSECLAESFTAHKQQFYLAFLTSFLYASHFPEVLAPGRFDFIGHSHQIFHICGTAATYKQFQAVLIDMTRRRDVVNALVSPPTFLSTLGQLGLLTASNLAIVGLFGLYVWNPKNLRNVKLRQAAERNGNGGKKAL